MSSNSINLCRLFDIVFHQILFINNVYVKRSFDCLQRCNIPIWKCIHPGVCDYLYKFLAVAQECFDQCQPIQIVFILKKYPDTVLDEYVFHIKPSQTQMTRDELDRNVVEIIQSLQAVVPEDNSHSRPINADLTFSLQIREEESDFQFPEVDENSSAVLVKNHDEEYSRILPLKKIQMPLQQPNEEPMKG